MNKSNIPVITIDGPSGSGKGTIGQMVAMALHWHFLDSGAIYRLLALSVIKQQMDMTDEEKIANLANNLQILFKVDEATHSMHCYLAAEDVTQDIRSELCGNTASKISKFPRVREALLTCQRNFLKSPGLIADGRDMGTIIFPNAPLKIFLEASCEARAERRYNQLIAKGINVSLAQILADITERDERDRNRLVSPLRPAFDAFILDTTNMSIENVYQWVMEKVKEHDLVVK